MGKKLTDLTERTATADTDLIHVNSSGTDYKESRSNFLKGDLYTTLSNSQTITASAEGLPAPGTYFGYISSYSHQSATGMPENANFYIKIERIASTGYITIEAWNINGAENSHYIKSKRNGTWDSTWTKIPSRSEITSINNSDALKTTSSAPNLSNTSYPANSIKVMSVTAPTNISQLVNVTVIGDYPSGSRQSLIVVSSWLYNGNVYVAVRNITSGAITATLQVQIWYVKSN